MAEEGLREESRWPQESPPPRGFKRILEASKKLPRDIRGDSERHRNQRLLALLALFPPPPPPSPALLLLPHSSPPHPLLLVAVLLHFLLLLPPPIVSAWAGGDTRIREALRIKATPTLSGTRSSPCVSPPPAGGTSSLRSEPCTSGGRETMLGWLHCAASPGRRGEGEGRGGREEGYGTRRRRKEEEEEMTQLPPAPLRPPHPQQQMAGARCPRRPCSPWAKSRERQLAQSPHHNSLSPKRPPGLGCAICCALGHRK